MAADALTAFGSAIAGALVGGAASGAVAWMSLHTTHRLDRAERRAQSCAAAASEVGAALVRCRQRLPEIVSQADARLIDALDELDITLIRTRPALSDAPLQSYLATARELLATDPDLAARVHALDETSMSQGFSRFDIDRRAYVDWVIELLRRTAEGQAPPSNVSPPASLGEPQAAPWVRPPRPAQDQEGTRARR